MATRCVSTRNNRHRGSEGKWVTAVVTAMHTLTATSTGGYLKDSAAEPSGDDEVGRRTRDSPPGASFRRMTADGAVARESNSHSSCSSSHSDTLDSAQGDFCIISNGSDAAWSGLDEPLTIGMHLSRWAPGRMSSEGSLSMLTERLDWLPNTACEIWKRKTFSDLQGTLRELVDDQGMAEQDKIVVVVLSREHAATTLLYERSDTGGWPSHDGRSAFAFVMPRRYLPGYEVFAAYTAGDGDTSSVAQWIERSDGAAELFQRVRILANGEIGQLEGKDMSFLDNLEVDKVRLKSKLPAKWSLIRRSQSSGQTRQFAASSSESTATPSNPVVEIGSSLIFLLSGWLLTKMMTLTSN